MTTASFDPLRPEGPARQMRGWSRASRARVPAASPAPASALDGLAQGLRGLMAARGRDLGFLFQPIVDVEHGRILGYEALTRGPADSPLHSPLVLFEVAARCGQLVEFERIVVHAIALRFRELGLPGRLFINLSPDSVVAARGRTQAILD
ncbi:MAG: EAL domain-containing protein, partial [Aquabacterium sp.]|nr:EAL domain-containing protein [Aquabacterium sp.]